MNFCRLCFYDVSQGIEKKFGKQKKNMSIVIHDDNLKIVTIAYFDEFAFIILSKMSRYDI